MNSQFLKVRIISPKESIFEDFALSVSSTNSAGNFDILPQHANFITIVQMVPIIIRRANKEIVTFQFPLAIVYTSNNQVNIYTDIQLNFGQN